MDRRFQVDRDLLPDRLPVPGLCELDPALDAGVVDQHVHAGKLPRRPIEKRGAVRRLPDVADERLHPGMPGLRFRQLVGPAATDCHVAARPKKALGQREADPRGAAGDEDCV
jgi:hypothetical protein